jgi:hypothetical protein
LTEKRRSCQSSQESSSHFSPLARPTRSRSPIRRAGP